MNDWRDITPDCIRKAVEALRKRFELNAWKVAEIMRHAVHAALHKRMTPHATVVIEAIKSLGIQAPPVVGGGYTEPMVFTAYFNLCSMLLAKEIRATFKELLSIATAQSASLSMEPIEWEAAETKVMVADESFSIALWTKDACDENEFDASDPDESLYRRKWRAPLWFYMQPFANRGYDQRTARDRMDEAETTHLLKVVENRFNQRLINALDEAVDEARIRAAKQPQPPNIAPSDEAAKPIETGSVTPNTVASPSQRSNRRATRVTTLTGLIADIKRKYPSDASNIEAMCKHLDSHNVPLPRSPKLRGKNSWHEAWSDRTTRNLIKRRIAGVQV